MSPRFFVNQYLISFFRTLIESEISLFTGFVAFFSDVKKNYLKIIIRGDKLKFWNYLSLSCNQMHFEIQMKSTIKVKLIIKKLKQ